MNIDSLYTHSRLEFCLALKAARERKGISLAEIAAKTKIPASLFEAFERNDLRRWPKGLFRRSFFRDYARTIGVPLAEACDEFVRLFPDHEAAEVAKPAVAVEVNQPGDVRLAFDDSWHGPRAAVAFRLLAAVIDAGVVIVLAVGTAWLAGMDLLATIGIVAVFYFSVATVLFGESPVKWLISRRHLIADLPGPVPAVVAAIWKGGADAISQGFASAEEETTEQEPRLRVRIKVPQ